MADRQVSTALNKAADDVVEAWVDELADAVNLVVNASLSYLTQEASTLEEAVALNYAEDVDTVVGWAAG